MTRITADLRGHETASRQIDLVGRKFAERRRDGVPGASSDEIEAAGRKAARGDDSPRPRWRESGGPAENRRENGPIWLLAEGMEYGRLGGASAVSRPLARDLGRPRYTTQGRFAAAGAAERGRGGTASRRSYLCAHPASRAERRAFVAAREDTADPLRPAWAWYESLMKPQKRDSAALRTPFSRAARNSGESAEIDGQHALWLRAAPADGARSTVNRLYAIPCTPERLGAVVRITGVASSQESRGLWESNPVRRPARRRCRSRACFSPQQHTNPQTMSDCAGLALVLLPATGSEVLRRTPQPPALARQMLTLDGASPARARKRWPLGVRGMGRNEPCPVRPASGPFNFADPSPRCPSASPGSPRETSAAPDGRAADWRDAPRPGPCAPDPRVLFSEDANSYRGATK